MRNVSIRQCLPKRFSIDSNWDLPVTGITCDSRHVKPGMVFIAVPGHQVDGRDYIDQAIQNGAIAVIAEHAEQQLELRGDTPVFYFPDVHVSMSEIAGLFYGEPSQDLDIIGVTGTNGKTSCTHYLAQALNLLEIPCGVIGTLGNGRLNQLNDTSLTTPDAITVQAQLAELLAENMQSVAMEVSSHALDQHRVEAVHITTAVLTNLSQDHLDYHKTMEHYANAKLKLFQHRNLKHAVLNLDDDFSRQVCQVLPANVQSFTYSTRSQAADLTVSDIHHSHHGLSAKVNTPWGKGELQTQLIGEFNLSNLLSVLACLCLRGIKLINALQMISLVRGAAGRMEVFKSRNEVTLIVDYAHTPDALAQALKAIKQHCKGRVICVFGCGGDRDKQKRPLMGQIAEQGADLVVLTNDNPRSEAPELIIDDIIQGMTKPDQVVIETDRKQAIVFAHEQAKPGDMILIAGKGHENIQIINQEKHHFSDIEVVQQLIKSDIVEPT